MSNDTDIFKLLSHEKKPILYEPLNRYENTHLFVNERIALIIFLNKYCPMNQGSTTNMGEMIRDRLACCTTMYPGNLYLHRYDVDGRLIFRNKISNMLIP